MDFDWQALWVRHIASDTLHRQARAKLSELDLEEGQAIWALLNYRKETVYPNPSDFIEWLHDAEGLPSPLVAAGLISHDSLAVDLARKLQTLEAAWIPTQSTKGEMEDLERKLKVAL